ncbi:hypothetical protein HDV05_007864, partial [Chytridiales sp. JEL 0842]
MSKHISSNQSSMFTTPHQQPPPPSYSTSVRPGDHSSIVSNSNLPKGNQIHEAHADASAGKGLTGNGGNGQHVNMNDASRGQPIHEQHSSSTAAAQHGSGGAPGGQRVGDEVPKQHTNATSNGNPHAGLEGLNQQGVGGVEVFPKKPNANMVDDGGFKVAIGGVAANEPMVPKSIAKTNATPKCVSLKKGLIISSVLLVLSGVIVTLAVLLSRKNNNNDNSNSDSGNAAGVGVTTTTTGVVVVGPTSTAQTTSTATSTATATTTPPPIITTTTTTQPSPTTTTTPPLTPLDLSKSFQISYANGGCVGAGGSSAPCDFSQTFTQIDGGYWQSTSKGQCMTVVRGAYMATVQCSLTGQLLRPQFSATDSKTLGTISLAGSSPAK